MIVANAAIGNDSAFWALFAKSILGATATVALAFVGVSAWAARAEKKRWSQQISRAVGQLVTDTHQALMKLLLTGLSVPAPILNVNYDELAVGLDLEPRRRPDSEVANMPSIRHATSELASAAVRSTFDAMRGLTAARLDRELLQADPEGRMSSEDQRVVVQRATAVREQLSSLAKRVDADFRDLVSVTPDDDLAVRLLESSAAIRQYVATIVEASRRPGGVEDRRAVQDVADRYDLADRAAEILTALDDMLGAQPPKTPPGVPDHETPRIHGRTARGERATTSAQDALDALAETFDRTNRKGVVPTISNTPFLIDRYLKSPTRAAVAARYATIDENAGDASASGSTRG